MRTTHTTRVDFPGQLAVVSGAAQGIGAAVVNTLCEHGITVAALDIQEQKLQQLTAASTAAGHKVHPFAVDITQGKAVRHIVDRIEAELGPIGMLVNVAGILRMAGIEALSDEDWEHSFAVNTHGVFYLSQAVAQQMMPRRAGSIVTVGSNAALVPRMQMAAYAASKAATHQLTKCLGLELAEYGIRCNIVAPGSTDTEMQRRMWTDTQGADAIIAGSLSSYRTGIPLGRIAKPEDIASAVVFLLSNAAKNITLHSLCADGGATLGV